MSVKTFKEMQDEVLDNVGVVIKTTTATTTARDKIKGWLNDAQREDWTLSTWEEAKQEDTVRVLAGENSFDLPSDFDTIMQIWNGSTPLQCIDPSTINRLDPQLWAYTGAPQAFYNKGKSGIRLIGQFTSATDLSIFGKMAYTEMSADSDTPCLDHDLAYVAHATSKAMLVYNRSKEDAAIYELKWQKFIQQKQNEARSQAASSNKIVPAWTWCADVESPMGHSGYNGNLTSKIPLF